MFNSEMGSWSVRAMAYDNSIGDPTATFVVLIRRANASSRIHAHFRYALLLLL